MEGGGDFIVEGVSKVFIGFKFLIWVLKWGWGFYRWERKKGVVCFIIRESKVKEIGKRGCCGGVDCLGWWLFGVGIVWGGDSLGWWLFGVVVVWGGDCLGWW